MRETKVYPTQSNQCNGDLYNPRRTFTGCGSGGRDASPRHLTARRTDIPAVPIGRACAVRRSRHRASGRQMARRWRPTAHSTPSKRLSHSVRASSRGRNKNTHSYTEISIETSGTRPQPRLLRGGVLLSPVSSSNVQDVHVNGLPTSFPLFQQ